MQRELTEWNQQFQALQGQLSRELQRELTALNHDFQADQGRLNREHALSLERFREKMQRWALEQQRELQLELKRLDAELAQELRAFDRETTLMQLRESRRLGYLPIGLLSEQILSTDLKQPLPLRVFFSPPNPRFGESANPAYVVKHFPHVEDYFSEKYIAGGTKGIRSFLTLYSTHGRTIDFIGGAWKDKSAQAITHEAAAKAVFAELQTEPILILESELVRFNFDLHFAFWGSNWAKPRYKTATSFSWREMLYSFAKLRTWQWKEQAFGKNQEELARLYGKETFNKYLQNLNTMGRERQAVAAGIDPQEIERHYHLHEKDYEKLSQFIATYHCLIAGLLADEYFLVHVPRELRQRPLLPKLLSNLLQDAPAESQQEFTAIMVEFYQTLCNALGEEESTWMPELKLDIALSLTELPDKSWAKQQIVDSIRSWMALRGMKPVELPEEGNISLAILIEAMGGGLMSMSDHDYLAKLDDCLSALYR